MKKKVVSIVVAGIMTMSPLLAGVGHAETLSSVKEKQNKVESQKEAARQQQDKIVEQLSELNDEIEKLDKSIKETKENIQKKESEIKKLKEEIDKLKEEIKVLNEKIDRRTDVLRNRLASYQQTGGSTSYIEVLLGSKNFSDLIGRISAVNELMSADKMIMEQQEEDLSLVEQKEKEALEKQDKYESQLKELKELEDSLKKQSEEKEKAAKKLESKKREVQKELKDLEKEGELLKEQAAAIKKAAEEAAQKAKEEAARKVKEETAKQAAQKSQSNESKANSASNQSSSNGGNTPAITAGLFMRPANGPVTSNFGGRTLNGAADDHPGIDIGKRGANVPIVAAADGVVIRSDFSSSYGNVVYISHNLNGKVYTTVYAHMESRSVQSGQSVKKGQKLGMMGNTGHSYGAHLHFEIHEGEWNYAKSNAVDPRKYINF